MNNFQLPPLFKWLQKQANISLFELTRTFNCGIGLLIFVDQKDVETILKDINNTGYKSFLIGSMIKNKLNRKVIFDGWEL